MSFGAFNKRSQSSSVANTSHEATQQSEIYGTAGSVNGSNNSLTMLDGGAIKQAFDFAAQAANESTGIAGEVAKQSVAIASNVAAKAAEDNSDKMAQLMRWGIGAAVVVGVAAMFRKGRS